jgi:F-type H+-transporting ATPase subunit epsilon
MLLEIITPEKSLFSSEDAKSVICPGIDGYFELLNNHAPLISALSNGEVKVTDHNNQKHQFKIASGLLECNKNKVSILVEE